MGQEGSKSEDIDRRLEGEPIQFGERRVQAVGRLKGKTFRAGNEQAGGTGAFITLQPEEVIVDEAGGPRTISLAPASDEPLRALFLAGGAVAGACLVVMFLSRRIIRRVLG